MDYFPPSTYATDTPCVGPWDLTLRLPDKLKGGADKSGGVKIQFCLVSFSTHLVEFSDVSLNLVPGH